MKIYEVGGSVRDSFMQIDLKNGWIDKSNPSIKDLDYAVECESYDRMVSELQSRGFKIFLQKPEFLTVRAKHPDFEVVSDFVLCRKESGYSDLRHPDRVEPGTIYDDLARRDFTVNAIAVDTQTREIIDPFCGAKDVFDRVIRCVGNPMDRFREDALRVLRALRFSVCLEDFAIEQKTWGAIANFPPESLSAISCDRRREELGKMFKHDSQEAIRQIVRLPWELQSAIFAGGIWLKSTTESK